MFIVHTRRREHLNADAGVFMLCEMLLDFRPPSFLLQHDAWIYFSICCLVQWCHFVSECAFFEIEKLLLPFYKRGRSVSTPSWPVRWARPKSLMRCAILYLMRQLNFLLRRKMVYMRHEILVTHKWFIKHLSSNHCTTSRSLSLEDSREANGLIIITRPRSTATMTNRACILQFGQSLNGRQ